jgi:hypothetical protein
LSCQPSPPYRRAKGAPARSNAAAPAERLEAAELAQKVADELHETKLTHDITALALDARALACLTLDLVNRFERLRATSDAFAWPELERLEEAGLSDDFLVTVEERGARRRRRRAIRNRVRHQQDNGG